MITQLRAELREAQRLVLATDDDREGEAISWHLLQVLNPKIPVFRAVFHEITPSAIETAFKNFRQLDMALVDAQETRRVLDRLAGYTMSPLLWRKVAKGLSAGRVQSVAMSVVVRREHERLLFRLAQFSGCTAIFATSQASQPSFNAALSSVNSVRLVRGSDFDDSTGQLRESIDPSTVYKFTNTDMKALCAQFRTASTARVTSVDCRRTTRNPPLPLITSTLQQECGNRLGYGAGKTMMLAQKLYETGLITYMRTDNPVLSDDAVTAVRATIEQSYELHALWQGEGAGRKGVKPKAAQAAHEAIRPTGMIITPPNELLNVTDEERAVYTIIYRRALASQMACAKLDQTTVKVAVNIKLNGTPCEAEFKTTGSVIVEPGFLLLYQEDNDNGSTSTFLPSVQKGDVINVKEVEVVDHETKPPPRFNDASLVKVLEEQGVGRPSTYAGIIEKLVARGYVYRGRDLPVDKKVSTKALVPSLTAFAVEHLLATHFPSFVDAQFTARMEEALDDIAAGSANRVNYLQQYYSGKDGLAESVERKENDIDARSFRRVLLPNMPREMVKSAGALPIAVKANKSIRETKLAETTNNIGDNDNERGFDWSTTKILVSSYGPYVEQDGTVIASLPKTTLADDLSSDRLQGILELAKDPVIGTDPETNQVVQLKTSRFGPYVQLGRDEDMPEGIKPKRCSLFPGMDVSEVTIDVALKLLSLPRVLGTHAETNEQIRATIGPYGPYVAHGTTNVSLRKDEHDVLNINFEQAMELLNAAEARKQKRLEKQAQRKAEKDAAAASAVKEPKKKSTAATSEKKRSRKAAKESTSPSTASTTTDTKTKATAKTNRSTRAKSAV